ncbi:uncharacterized protein LOC141695694 [Apium graveolens]|uniref:uncharacterized protein LOC141695694 n=1 Tax=Apium graveolens TaxID=4045 RepID=UPI003D7B1569
MANDKSSMVLDDNFVNSKKPSTGASNLSFENQPSLQITIHKLNSQNFLQWSRSVTLYLRGRGLFGYLNGDTLVPEKTDSSFAKWDSENSLIMAWLINSMEMDIGKTYLFLSTVQELWDAVKEAYSDLENFAQVFELKSKLRDQRQQNLTMLDRERLFNFFHGLNRELDEVRGRILGKSHLPSVHEAFAEVRREESRNRVMMGLTTTAKIDNSALSVRNHSMHVVRDPNFGSDFRRTRKERPWCTTCNKPGHLDISSGKTIGSAKACNGLYYFDEDLPSTQLNKNTIFGCNVSGYDDNMIFRSRPYKASHPFSLIHSDIWGPSKVSNITDTHWFITFIDDHTRVSWVYVLKNKSNVAAQFKNLYSIIQTQFNANIQVLHSDNGTEYFNSILGDYLLSHGIIHKSSCVGTLQQNRIAERKNHHLLEVARALMFTKNVPKYFWGEAILMAAYLINRMPSRVLQYKTSLSILLTVYPNIHLLSNLSPKAFGCTSYVHVLGPNTKFDPRA